MKVKKIQDFYMRERCSLDGTECVPWESPCAFVECLTKLLWGLREDSFREEAIKELEHYLEEK